MEIIKLPTGYLIVDKYYRGQLETLSIGDYGKSKNIKASFLGREQDINGVPNGEILPLQEKWVITLSTQYGCPMECTFCDVPNVKFGGNATITDLRKQLYTAIKIQNVKYTDRLNVHFARMGEPLFNSDVVFDFSKWMYTAKFHGIYKDTGLRVETIHPVFTTMLPIQIPSEYTYEKLREWCDIKNRIYNGQAGLQLSINSTDEAQRQQMFNGKTRSLKEISIIVNKLNPPVGRKYCLNFALADGYETDGIKLLELFDPEKWMVKITPIHNNTSCAKNKIKTSDGYCSFTPYKKAEESFKSAGFDVIIFIPSQDEEDGLITCGNAILGGSKLKLKE